ncbi:MAG: ABC transporter substrate-binding protein [Chloroflexi bacterium]|nr:ABC transporter substrate-binding protein [Chloroflexota bacterium]
MVPTATTEQRAEQQVLRVAQKTLVTNLTPQASPLEFPTYWALYDNLLQFADQNYRLEPSVATRWEVGGDGRSWRFTIRNDLKFSNWDPLTAEDVAFSLLELKQRNWPNAGNFVSVTAARAVDATTVEITTTQPDMSVPNAVTLLWILPRRYYEAAGGFDGFRARPIGSGPYYEVVEFRPGDLIRFRKRTDGHPFRQPIAEELIFRAIPENAQILNGLRSGEVDVALGVNWLGDQANQLKSLGMQLLAFPLAYNGIFMPWGLFEVKPTPLKEVRVRQALNYAIDRERLARSFFAGYAEPANQDAIPGSLYYLPTAPKIPYDPAKAKQLLAEAGYSQGFKLTMDYTISQTPPEIAVAVQSFLREIGVEVELSQLEQAVFVDKAFGRNNLLKGDLWAGRNRDTLGFGPSRAGIGCGKPVGAPPTTVNYCNPEWDRLMDLAYAERDPQRRQQLLQQANQVELNDWASIFLLIEPGFVAATSRVRGVVIQHSAYHKLDSFYLVR